MYFNLKDYLELQSELNSVVKSKLAAKIPLYKPDTNIILQPIGSMNDKAQYIPVSVLSIENLFANDDINYFAEKVSQENRTMIYVLSSETPVLKNFKVTFLPHNYTVYQSDNSEPVVIDSMINIERILLELVVEK